MINKILVTGASSGIGLALCNKFLLNRNEVTGVARDFSKTDCSGLQKVELDLADIEKLPNELQTNEILKQDFDALILNAGVGRFGGIEQFSYQQIQNLINTNLLSNLFLLKHYLPKFKSQGSKDIVLIGSESSLQGAKQGSIYCATKFAIRGLAQSLRADCSNADIRVVLVNPGPVVTDFFNELDFQPQTGVDFSLSADTVAQSVFDALALPRNAVIEEINLQPMKRSFQKK